MTAQLHYFPVPAAFIAQREAETRRGEIVTAARAVLRSAARHEDAILTEACVALQTWGDGTDWLEADAMLLAVRLRARRKAHDAAKIAARKDTIRTALVLAFAATIATALAPAILKAALDHPATLARAAALKGM